MLPYLFTLRMIAANKSFQLPTGIRIMHINLTNILSNISGNRRTLFFNTESTGRFTGAAIGFFRKYKIDYLFPCESRVRYFFSKSCSPYFNTNFESGYTPYISLMETPNTSHTSKRISIVGQFAPVSQLEILEGTTPSLLANSF